MNITIQRIYEIQNIGKGVINAITPDNLLLTRNTEQTVPGLQDVISSDNELPFGNIIFIEQYLLLDSDSGAQGGRIDINNSTVTSNIAPATRIGKGIGNTSTDVSLGFFLDNVILNDGANLKGIINGGDYETNFVPRSLVTKQYVDGKTTGSETKVNAGTNITVTGTGTTGSPYIINATTTSTPTVINAGTNISITGAGTSGSPFVITNTQVVDGSETKVNSGITTSVTGTGTTGSPYVVETVNLQKAIASNYTVLSADNNYSIKINNGATPITITVPAGLPTNFFAGFTQKGTADVTFVGSGTTIVNPVGLKIKGQGYCVGLEQIGISNSYDLLADTKI